MVHFPRLKFIPCGTYSTQWNMAADSYLMQNCEMPTLRFYQWSNPSLSFGKANLDIESLDFEVVAQNNIEGVIRKTGGKTVLHQYELTYSFVIKKELFPLSILKSYQCISEILSKSFHILGLQCDVSQKKQRTRQSSICFKEIASYEICIKNKKIVGSAQYRNKDVILQHGSILLKIDWNMWQKIWKINNIDVLKNRITSFNDENCTIECSDLTAIICNIFCNYFQCELIERNFTSKEKELISILSQKFYFEDFYNKIQKFKSNSSQIA